MDGPYTTFSAGSCAITPHEKDNEAIPLMMISIILMKTPSLFVRNVGSDSMKRGCWKMSARIATVMMIRMVRAMVKIWVAIMATTTAAMTIPQMKMTSAKMEE